MPFLGTVIGFNKELLCMRQIFQNQKPKTRFLSYERMNLPSDDERCSFSYRILQPKIYLQQCPYLKKAVQVFPATKTSGFGSVTCRAYESSNIVSVRQCLQLSCYLVARVAEHYDPLKIHRFIMQVFLRLCVQLISGLCAKVCVINQLIR